MGAAAALIPGIAGIAGGQYMKNREENQAVQDQRLMAGARQLMTGGAGNARNPITGQVEPSMANPSAIMGAMAGYDPRVAKAVVSNTLEQMGKPAAIPKMVNIFNQNTRETKIVPEAMLSSVGPGWVLTGEVSNTPVVSDADKILGLIKQRDALYAANPNDPNISVLNDLIKKGRGYETDPQAIAARAAKIKADEAAVANAANGILGEDDLNFMAAQALTGDQSVMQGLGYGQTGATNRANLRKAMNKMATDRGMAPQEVAAMNVQMFGDRAQARTIGTRTANVDMAVREADQFADLALEQSSKVPRGKWVPINSVMNAYASGSGDPEMRRFGAFNNSFLNAYATAVGKGTMTVEGRKHAEDMLSTADGPEAYKAVISALKQEMAAALASPEATSDALTRRIEGRGKETDTKPKKWIPGVGVK